MGPAAQKRERLTLTDQMRVRFKGVVTPVAAFFNRLGITPNAMTLLGLAGNIIEAFVLARGELFLGGLIILLMAPVDALDGTMARLRGEKSDFGAFLDSVIDRYSELVIYMGLVYHYSNVDNHLGVGLVYGAAAGSVLVSYIRARGHSLGCDTKVGILTRMERIMVLVPSLLLSFIPFVDLTLLGIGLIALLTNITAVQRIIDVRRQIRLRSVEQPAEKIQF